MICSNWELENVFSSVTAVNSLEDKNQVSIQSAVKPNPHVDEESWWVGGVVVVVWRGGGQTWVLLPLLISLTAVDSTSRNQSIIPAMLLCRLTSQYKSVQVYQLEFLRERSHSDLERDAY